MAQIISTLDSLDAIIAALIQLKQDNPNANHACQASMDGLIANASAIRPCIARFEERYPELFNDE